MQDLQDKVISRVARDKLSERFHSNTDINAVLEMDYEEAGEIIKRMNNLELLEVISRVFERDGE